MKKPVSLLLLLAVLLSACSFFKSDNYNPADILDNPAYVPQTGGESLSPTQPAVLAKPSATFAPTATFTPAPTSTPTPIPLPPKAVQENQVTKSGMPVFEHVIVIMFESRNYTRVVGRKDLPIINRLLKENVSFERYYGVTHPGLPNYLALIGGDTYGINSDCLNCTVNKPSLPDLLDKAGYTWRAYQESMPGPCTLDNADKYLVNHNPFVYFDSIRNDPARCQRSVLPLTALDSDLSQNALPNFVFIMPDACNSASVCDMSVAEVWLGKLIDKLTSSPALGKNYMIFFTFDQADADNSSCCGIKQDFGGGHIVAGLISPRARSPYQDLTPMTHYGLLKTILSMWGLPDLGFTSSPFTVPIVQSWK